MSMTVCPFNGLTIYWRPWASVLSRQWVTTLHSHAGACFMLHSLLPDQEVEFSICQGDPAASVFFTIYIESFLVIVEQRLHGLYMGGLHKLLSATWIT
jgi:hypothetical protein